MDANITVTMPLHEYDALRSIQQNYRDIVRDIAACFDYSFTLNPCPQECADCPTASESYALPKNSPGAIRADCTQCEVFKKYNEIDEHLTVDVERLINVTKDFALCGKDTEADISEVEIRRKAEDVGA